MANVSQLNYPDHRIILYLDESIIFVGPCLRIGVFKKTDVSNL
ncbi:hypothetical protein [Neobacillus niacini]|nr:hypothetical protein [Neobacillus niacini]